MPALALAIALLFLQTPKASIDGVILRTDTNAPIAGARVLLYPVAYPATPSQTVVTDNAGRFSFAGLNAGEYRVHADVKGYAIDWLAQTFGDSAIPGRPVTLKDGQRVQDFQYPLTPEGIVSGRVRGATGEPVADVEVQLVLGRYNAIGRKTYVTAAALRTNDRGEYRFYGLEPNRFYLRVAAPLGTRSGARSEVIADTIGTDYLPTFFPNATVITESTLLDVKAGSPLENVDVTLRKRASTQYRIQGRITDARGPLPPGGVQYTFFSLPREGTTGFRMSSTAPDGTFEIPDLDPGTHIIQASVQAPVARPQPGEPRAMFPTLYAFATVQVVSGDVSGVNLTLRSIPLTGKVRMDGPEPLPPGLQVRLTPSLTGLMNSPPPAVVQPDGSVVFVNVSEGAAYDLSVVGLPRDLYVKEGHQSLRLSDGPVVPLDIVIGAKGAGLMGTTAGSARIALVPADRLRRDLFRFATADADGKFSLRGIAPGDYKLFAFEKESEPYAAFDSDFLASRERDVANTLHIEESSTLRVDVHVTPASK